MFSRGLGIQNRVTNSYPPKIARCKQSYRIYSINRPGRLLNFWTLRVGAYSRWALIRDLALIKFSPFSAVKYVYFATKQYMLITKREEVTKQGVCKIL